MRTKILSLILLLPSLLWAASAPALPDGWSENFAYVNGIRVNYYRAVPAPGKPVIVAIHGVMDTGLTWASVAQKLQKDYDIYMVDTRGHGLSDPFNGTEDGDTLVKDVVEFVQKMGFQKPILMGHSLGGATVIRVCAEHPDLAKAIVVVDAGIGGGGGGRAGGRGGRGGPPAKAGDAPARGGNAPAATAAAPIPPGPREVTDPSKIQVNMRGTPDVLVGQNNYRFEDLVARANARWSPMDRQYWALAIKRYHGPYTENASQALSGPMRSEGALAKIPVPMVILKADTTPEGRKANEEAAKVMQRGKLVHIDGTGHNLHRDDPEQTYKALTAFLSTL